MAHVTRQQAGEHEPAQERGGMVPRLLLTPEEAAEALGISRAKIYQLLRSEIIESIRIDRCRRIPIKCLEEFIDRLRKEVA
jgi:excisionase family DNA binding protein